MATEPDWITIRIVLAAIELGSVARAASRCGIANSAAAKRVQDLEAQCGMRLFARTARGVRPTAAGEIFARHARTLSDFAARLGEDMATLATGGLGRVRLGATPSVIAGAWLAGDLARFGAARPGIAIELREASSLPVLQDLLDGRVDLGIVTTGGVIPAGLQAQPWREDRLLAAMPAGHPLAGRASLRFAELLDHRMIGVLEGGALALLLDSVAEQLGRRQHHSFRVTSTDAARRLVAGGHGICVMPDGLLVPYAAALGLRGVPLAEPWAVRRLRLVSQPPGSLAVPARLLRDHLLAPESP